MRRDPEAQRVFRARRLLWRPDQFVEGGGLVVARGTVVRILGGPKAVVRAARAAGGRAHDLGDVLIVPGLVNSHAHLELSGLAGVLPEGSPMVDWVRELVARREHEHPSDRVLAARGAARALLRSGTTLLGDVDSTGVFAALGSRATPRRIVFREALDAGDSERRRAVLRALTRSLPRRELSREGISPHAPHTVSAELLSELGRLAARRACPIQVHWSETAEEVRWLLRGDGPFRALLGASPRCSGLDLLERSGLLGERTSLVHGNCPRRLEPERIARSGASIVHCPGSHAFFRRPRFPIERYRRARVPLALGTDSLASNQALDMRREMKLLRASHPELDPADVWTMATSGGARALGFAGRAGELSPGAFADFAVFASEANGIDEALDDLTGGLPAVAGLWIAGRRVPL